jgi:hypothetical protein
MKTPESGASSAERVTGIEPALSAWEADVLPLNYTRVVSETLHEGPKIRDLRGPRPVAE